MDEIKGFHSCFAGASHFSLLVQRKVTKRSAFPTAEWLVKHSRDTSRCGYAASVPCAPRGPGGRRTTRFAQTRAPLRPPSRCGARLALRRGKSKAEEQKQPQEQEPKPKAPLPNPLLHPACEREGKNPRPAATGEQRPIPPSPDPRQGAPPPPAASCTP